MEQNKQETVVESRQRRIRITTGLFPEEYTKTPMVDLLHREACYKELFVNLHPDGFKCECGSDERICHGKTRACFPIYMCKAEGCSKTYTILTGTPLSGTKLGARELVLFMRLWAAGVGNADISMQIGLHKNNVAVLKQKLEIYSGSTIA